MIKKFDEFLNEDKDNNGNKVPFLFNTEKDDDKKKERLKQLHKEKIEKDRKEKEERLQKMEMFFNYDLSDDFDKKDYKLESVLEDILEYLEKYKTPIKKFFKNKNIDNEFMKMLWNIHKIYILNGKDKSITIQEIKDSNEYKEVKKFHKKIIKHFLGIKDAFASADKEHETVVKTFYTYLMYADRIYDIFDDPEDFLITK